MNGKIYKIIGNGLTYYGSTIQYYKQRFWFFKNKPSQALLPIMNDPNVQIEIVELYPCNTKQELLQRERWYIENNECVNKNRPIITEEEKKEYRQTEKYKNKKCEENKNYYHKNKEKNINRVKQYNNENPDKVKERSKKYRETHKEKLKEKNRLYYLRKKATIINESPNC
jgi:hypothetical protein